MAPRGRWKLFAQLRDGETGVAMAEARVHAVDREQSQAQAWALRLWPDSDPEKWCAANTSLLKRQGINQNQTLRHPGSLTWGKPPYTVSFLPASQFQSCLHKSTERTGEHYAPCATPLLILQEHKPAQPLGRLNPPPPHTKLKSINNKLFFFFKSKVSLLL
jgi:hypothetical protein